MPDATGQALSAFTFASSSTTTSVTTSSTATPTADAATLSSSGSPSPASHTASTSAGPSQSLSSSPNSTKNPSPNHLSAGGIAGIAIACAVVGAAFALALMWFLQRSQSRSSSKHHKPHLGRTHKSLRHEKDEEKIFDHSAITSLGTQPKVDVDAFLPQQADDATVKQKLLLLFDQIELHVDNFYNEDGQHLTSEQQSDISRYAKADLPMPLVSILETSHRRTTVLKHCLAYHAVHLVSPSNQTDCLLPYEVSSTLAYSEAHPDAFRRNPDQVVALSRWRMLTAYLRPDIFGGNVSSSSDSDAHIHDLASKFCETFSAFSQPGHEEQKVKHLAEVFCTARRVALWLYSQPATFRFHWGFASDGSSRSGQMTVVTVPSLLKTYDSLGSKIESPQVIQPLVRKRV